MTKEKAKKYIVRLYDGFDNTWIDVSGPVTMEKATKIYNEKTGNGKHNTKYDDIDYYRIFPVGTKMVFS